MERFPHLNECAERLTGLQPPLSPEAMVDLLCGDCPFYHPDREEQLECGSFWILRRLIDRGVVTPPEIVDVCRD